MPAREPVTCLWHRGVPPRPARGMGATANPRRRRRAGSPPPSVAGHQSFGCAASGSMSSPTCALVPLQRLQVGTRCSDSWPVNVENYRSHEAAPRSRIFCRQRPRKRPCIFRRCFHTRPRPRRDQAHHTPDGQPVVQPPSRADVPEYCRRPIAAGGGPHSGVPGPVPLDIPSWPPSRASREATWGSSASLTATGLPSSQHVVGLLPSTSGPTCPRCTCGRPSRYSIIASGPSQPACRPASANQGGGRFGSW